MLVLAVALVVCLPPVLLLLLLVGVLLLQNVPETRRAIRLANSFPHPKSFPILGHLMHVLKSREELFWMSRSFREAIGSRYSVTVLSKPAVNLCDPDAAEAVLCNSKNTTKGMAYEFLKPWLGRGLLTSSGALWHSRRKLLTPAFHFRILGRFSEHLEHQSDTLVQELFAHTHGKPMNIVPLVSRVTLRSICVTAMGQVDFNAGGGEDSYFQAIHRVGSTIVHRMCRPWLWWSLAFFASSTGRQFQSDLHTLHSFTAKMISDRKHQLFLEKDKKTDDHEDVKSRRPFLDVLLRAQENGEPLSDQDIREEVDTFMFEGHDTTAMALCWALELLGRHPDEQELLAQEIRDAPADWNSVSKLPYLDRVLKECLRLRPSVPLIARMLTSDIALPDGLVIPKSSAVHLHIYDLHRHPEHFPDPERFDPDRFLPEMEQGRHPFAYIPFSAGPRNCIGKRFAQMEVKLLLSAVIRNFVVRSAMPSENLEVIVDLVLRPKDSIRLMFMPRDA